MASRFVARIDYNRIPVVLHKLRAGSETIVARTANEIERGMTADVAVDTGDLKRSIRSAKVREMMWQIIVGAGHGIYVELGTINMAAQPFMLPNVERQRPIFYAAFRAMGRNL